MGLVKKVLIVLVVVIIVAIAILYCHQEKFLFRPEKIDPEFNYKFDHGVQHEDYYFEVGQGIKLHTVLFKTRSNEHPELIIYLHGNAGSIRTWGNIAPFYTKLGYDLLIVDYRGYGKSDGNVISESQLFSDNQIIYNAMKIAYPETRITLIGYSIGTGLASKLAADNRPKQVILKAPYYSLVALIQDVFHIPSILLKYKIETCKYLSATNARVSIFHGDDDELIPFKHGVRLADEVGCELIRLQGSRHTNLEENPQYHINLTRILS